jgi:hypothetical protein
VTFSARSFFGREALRTLLIGRTVSVSGATSSIQQRPTISAVEIVVQLSFDDLQHYAAASPAPAVSVDVVKHLLSHYPQWYSISLGTSSFPLVGSAHEVLPLHLLLQALKTTTHSSNADAQFNSPESQSAAVAEQKSVGTSSKHAAACNPVDVLYIQSHAHLQHALRAHVLPLGTPLPCLVEGVHCWVDDAGGIQLKCDVYCTTVGAVVPVALLGLQLPTASEPLNTAAMSSLYALAESMKTFLTQAILHREASVSLLEPLTPPQHSSSHRKQSEGLLWAVVMTEQFPSLLHGLIERGFGIASGLFVRIPPEPSFSLLASQDRAQASECELWSSAHKDLRDAMELQRTKKTGISHAPCSLKQLLDSGVEIIPLSYEDCETFTYRLVSDNEVQRDIDAALRAAQPLRVKYQPSVGEIVSAPYFDYGFLRAKILGTNDDACTVEFVDVGTVSPTPIALSALKTYWRGRKNILAQWAPLARRARHAMIDLSIFRTILGRVPLRDQGESNTTLAPVSVGEEPSLVSALNFNNDGCVAPLQRAQPPDHPLALMLSNFLTEKMEFLVSISQLRMYTAYEKDGIAHVLLKPTMEPLDSSENVTFELKLWQELLQIEHSAVSIELATSEPVGITARGRGRRQASRDKHCQQSLQRQSIVDLDQGCVEFPSLTRLVAQFLAVRNEIAVRGVS